MASERPILVTGGPRSGTTWVGKMIAASPSVRYIHEPFSIDQRPCSCGVKFDTWFYYVPQRNTSAFHEHIVHSLGSPLNKFNALNLAIKIGAATHLKDALRLLRNQIRSLLATRPLIKDPIALMSAEWLASAFDMDAVVIIRHPAALISSYKRLNWSHPFSHFLNQPQLMKEHLYPFEDEIRDYADREHDILDQGILLWRITHYMIRKYCRQNPAWTLVRHEDLSRDPLNRFRAIYDCLGLEYSERIQHVIQAHTDPANSIEPRDPYSIKRNSRMSVDIWKTRLAPAEIKRIRAGVEDVVGAYYSDEDW